jgi:hypothetical protein
MPRSLTLDLAEQWKMDARGSGGETNRAEIRESEGVSGRTDGPFNVPVERLGLDGLDPDEDLVGTAVRAESEEAAAGAGGGRA